MKNCFKIKRLVLKCTMTKIACAWLLLSLESVCIQANDLSWSSPQRIAGASRMRVSIAVDANNAWHVVYDGFDNWDPWHHTLAALGNKILLLKPLTTLMAASGGVNCYHVQPLKWIHRAGYMSFIVIMIMISNRPL
jgi:hypothetical protein